MTRVRRLVDGRALPPNGRLRELAPPLALAIGVIVLLALFADVDPAPGVTFSNSPFTDEAWYSLNARNLVLLGRWSTDDWNLHLLTLPYSAAQVIVFAVVGPGIVQARLVTIAAVGAIVAVLGLGLRGALGRHGALLAATASAGSALILYYGRLAYAEPLVALALCGGVLLALPDSRRTPLVGFAAGMCLALAVGTKPNAAFAVLGVLGAAAILSARADRALRGWLAGAASAIAVAAVTWFAVVWLPHREALAAFLRVLPPQRPPASVGEAVARVNSYLLASDGVFPGQLPLLAGALIGTVVAGVSWPRLDIAQRRLLVLTLGWLVVGAAWVSLIPYRPSRYVVPLVPAAAILAGATLIGSRRLAANRSLVVVLAVALVLPGLVSYGGWLASGTRRLPEIQANAAAALPAGTVVSGTYAPVFAMTAPVVALIPQPRFGLNDGDLYEQRAVRAVVAALVEGVPEAPSWARSHRAAWAARREVMCAPWGQRTLCLYLLPDEPPDGASQRGRGEDRLVGNGSVTVQRDR